MRIINEKTGNGESGINIAPTVPMINTAGTTMVAVGALTFVALALAATV